MVDNSHSMPSINFHITGAEKLTSIYGHWPSFHVAEVIEFALWRGEIMSGHDAHVGPTIMARVHVLMDGPISQDTLATLRFEDVDELRMEGFNHQNAIFNLRVAIQDRGKFGSGESLSPYLVVEFQPAFGMSASFRCLQIEVVDAVRCTEDGKPCA
jgi:hypothetical protein